MNILAVLGMGFTSILVQIIALRQLLTVFSGNELDIGITLAVWLLAVGLGSIFGRRFRYRNAFEYSFFGVALLAQTSVLFISLIHPVFGLVAGETVPLTTTVLSTVLALAPVCFMIGTQFPLAVAFLKGDTARTYGLEAAGSFLGGLFFTVLFAGNVNAFALVAAVSFVNILLTIVLLKKKRRFLFLVIPLLFHVAATTIVENAPEQDLDLVQRVESKYGELALYDSDDQLNLFTSGRFAFSYPDEQTEELRAHVPMSLHESPGRVLLIGGSAAVARELLKYPAVEVDFVEIDPKMIDLCFSILTREDRERLGDKRLKVNVQDARSFVRSAAKARYDIVILNLPEPSTANLNRFYTVEFFREARAILNPGGVLALTLPASHGYIGRRLQAANGSIYRSLKAVFPTVALSSEEYGGMYASDRPLKADPDELAMRFSARGVQTEYFYPLIFKDIFDPMKTDMVAARLGAVDTLNRDRRPVAYLYNLMLWTETHGGAFLNSIVGAGEVPVLTAFAALLLTAVVLFWRKQRTFYYSLFTTGYFAMAFNVAVLLMYQASFGYVYERIGILSALFMAGTAAGASGARFLKRSQSWVQALDVASLLLLLVAPLFFTLELFYYVMVLLCGAMAGMQFALISRLIGGAKPGEHAGRLYAVDLGGAVLGALSASILFVPLLGVGNAILSLIALKASSLVLLMVLGHEKN